MYEKMLFKPNLQQLGGLGLGVRGGGEGGFKTVTHLPLKKKICARAHTHTHTHTHTHIFFNTSDTSLARSQTWRPRPILYTRIF